MLGLAGDLGARMIAEGIETEGELAALRRLGVPFGQGYLLGRPTVEVDEHTKKLGVIDVPAVGAPLRGVG
jgi:EAL domain-containing protein (putative c-di-GMP-specific phosphodiesterase class I)